jgi:hypothetical protein
MALGLEEGLQEEAIGLVVIDQEDVGHGAYAQGVGDIESEPTPSVRKDAITGKGCSRPYPSL